MDKIVIVGNSDFAKHVYIQLSPYYDIVGFCVDAEYIKDDKFCGLPLVSTENIERIYPQSEYKLLVAIGYNKCNMIRENLFNRLKKIGYSFVSFIHSSSVVHPTAKIGDNCIIFENVTIQPLAIIEDNCIIWPSAVICHDSIIRQNCCIGSNATVNGYAEIKNNSFLGSSANIRDKITIGAYNIVGAGCTILGNTKDYSVYKSSDVIRLPVDSRKIII